MFYRISIVQDSLEGIGTEYASHAQGAWSPEPKERGRSSV